MGIKVTRTDEAADAEERQNWGISDDDEEKECDDRERAADMNSTGGAW